MIEFYFVASVSPWYPQISLLMKCKWSVPLVLTLTSLDLFASIATVEEQNDAKKCISKISTNRQKTFKKNSFKTNIPRIQSFQGSLSSWSSYNRYNPCLKKKSSSCISKNFTDLFAYNSVKFGELKCFIMVLCIFLYRYKIKFLSLC